MRKSNTQLRAEAYYSGKEQLVKAITTLANHLHAPPPAQRKLPENIVAHDLSKIRQAHMKVREIADMYGLELWVKLDRKPLCLCAVCLLGGWG